MQIQKSYEGKTGGKLYLVATPIGNLQDMSPRAVEILQAVDLIAAEDTRHTRKLLSHFQFTTPLCSLHEHNEKRQMNQLVHRLQQGEQIAVVSDAGMPAISDPGELFVAAATAANIDVIPIPGPNAALTALVASGLPVQPFLFYGFLPRQQRKRREILQQLQQTLATTIFYESPYRIVDMLSDLHYVYGECEVAVVRELTKRYEEWIRGNISDCNAYIREQGARGEYTVVVAPPSKENQSVAEHTWWHDLDTIKHVEFYLNEGFGKKEAIKQVSQERGLPKRTVYNEYHDYAKKRGY